jgi:hypothetical protein
MENIRIKFVTPTENKIRQNVVLSYFLYYL